MAKHSDKDLTQEQYLADQFFDLYRGLNRAFGRWKVTNTVRDDNKVQGRATTEIGDYNVKLWAQHLNGNASLGVIPITDEGTCQWGAIDIDEYPLDLNAIEEKVRSLGLPLITLRTKSGGAHLVMFLNEPVPAKLVRAKLYEFALAMGYGGVEIFPKQNMLASKADVGNWLNMPYFEHHNTTRYAIFKGEKMSALQFIELARMIRIDQDTLEKIQVDVKGDFEDGPPCLQMITRNKIPEGTRNNTLFAIGVYTRLKFEDDWQDKIDDMNRRYITPPLGTKEVSTLVKSLGRKEYFYPCNKAPLISSCNKDLCRKRTFGIGQGDGEFTLNLGSLIKIATEPPIWIMDVEGIRVQLDTEDLMSQERFRRACVMSINKLPPRVKANDWDKIVREKLETVELIEAPVESRAASRINQFAFQYLATTPAARVKDEILLGRPYHDKETNTICFSGNALLKHLDNNGLKAEPRKIWSSLRENGATHSTIKVKGIATQVWRIDASLVPDIKLDLPPEDDVEF